MACILVLLFISVTIHAYAFGLYKKLMIRNPFSKQLKSSASVHLLHCSMSSGSTSSAVVL